VEGFFLGVDDNIFMCCGPILRSQAKLFLRVEATCDHVSAFSAMISIVMTQISVNPNCLVTRRQPTLLPIVTGYSVQPYAFTNPDNHACSAYKPNKGIWKCGSAMLTWR
jgi:hypothetical protein